MSRDADWTQRMLREMNDSDRDSYIMASRLYYDYTMKYKAICSLYKPQIQAIKGQRDKDLSVLDTWLAETQKELGL